MITEDNNNNESQVWNINEMREFLNIFEPQLEVSDEELEFWIEVFVRDNILEVVWDEDGYANYRLTKHGQKVCKTIGG